MTTPNDAPRPTSEEDQAEADLRQVAYDAVVRVRGSSDAPAFDLCVGAEYRRLTADILPRLQAAQSISPLNRPALFRRLIREAAASLQALEARNAELEGALSPFAKEADIYDAIPGVVVTHDNVELWQRSSHRTKLTVGDLRKARAALHPATETGET